MQAELLRHFVRTTVKELLHETQQEILTAIKAELALQATAAVKTATETLFEAENMQRLAELVSNTDDFKDHLNEILKTEVANNLDAMDWGQELEDDLKPMIEDYISNGISISFNP